MTTLFIFIVAHSTIFFASNWTILEKVKPPNMYRKDRLNNSVFCLRHYEQNSLSYPGEET